MPICASARPLACSFIRSRGLAPAFSCLQALMLPVFLMGMGIGLALAHEPAWAQRPLFHCGPKAYSDRPCEGGQRVLQPHSARSQDGQQHRAQLMREQRERTRLAKSQGLMPPARKTTPALYVFHAGGAKPKTETVPAKARRTTRVARVPRTARPTAAKPAPAPQFQHPGSPHSPPPAF